MKTSVDLFSFSVKLSLLAVLSSSAVAVAADGVVGPGQAAAPAVLMTVPPSATFAAAGHVVNGAPLRNMMSATIATRGIPAGAVIKGAYLYWNYGNNVATGTATEPILFNGHLVLGVKVSDTAGLCWGTVGTHTYRAAVTPFLPAANPNQDYVVGGGGDTTSGLNPWAAPSNVRKNNGVALAVFYGGAGVVGDAMLYDRFTGSAMIGGAHTFTLTHAAQTGAAEFSMVGADGQRGGTHTNTASNEIGKFNTVQFSGPPVAASDWDGSSGLPLPQLWDVHTHNVNLSGTSSAVNYSTPGDCVAPVAFIVDKK